MIKIFNRFSSCLKIVISWLIDIVKAILKPETLATNIVLALFAGIILSHVIPNYLVPHPDMSLTCTLSGKNKIIEIENYGNSAAEEVYLHVEFSPQCYSFASSVLDNWLWRDPVINNSFKGSCFPKPSDLNSQYGYETLLYRKYVLPETTATMTLLDCENSQIKVKISGKNFGVDEVKC